MTFTTFVLASLLCLPANTVTEVPVDEPPTCSALECYRSALGALRDSQPDEALKYCDEGIRAIELLEKRGSKIRKAQLHEIAGDAHTLKGEYSLAARHYGRAKSLFEANYTSDHWRLTELTRKLRGVGVD